jgi:hypothetical protein
MVLKAAQTGPAGKHNSKAMLNFDQDRSHGGVEVLLRLGLFAWSQERTDENGAACICSIPIQLEPALGCLGMLTGAWLQCKTATVLKKPHWFCVMKKGGRRSKFDSSTSSLQLNLLCSKSMLSIMIPEK